MSSLERIDAFLVDLKAIPAQDTPRIWGRCLSEIKHLKTGSWVPAGAIAPQRGYAPATVRSVLRDYRHAIRSQLGDTHPALRYLRPSAATQQQVKDDQTARIYAMHHNLRPISCEELVDTADKLLSSPRSTAPLAVAAGLLLVTGRRPWEILSTGAFTPAGNDALVFSGQAKTRGAESAQTGPYTIPVLTDPDRIVFAFQALRDRYSLSGLDYKKAHGRYSKTLGQYTRHYFKDENHGKVLAGSERQHEGGITPSDLRAAYATIAFEWFGPDDVSLNAYFACILGHSEYDFVTSLSYCTFYPIGEKRDFVREFRRGTQDVIDGQTRLLASEQDEERRSYLVDRISKFQNVLLE